MPARLTSILFGLVVVGAGSVSTAVIAQGRVYGPVDTGTVPYGVYADPQAPQDTGRADEPPAPAVTPADEQPAPDAKPADEQPPAQDILTIDNPPPAPRDIVYVENSPATQDDPAPADASPSLSQMSPRDFLPEPDDSADPSLASPADLVSTPDFASTDQPSDAAARVVEWVKATRDNGDLPFMVIDKIAAQLYAYDASGQAIGQVPVLVGIAKGDDSAPGVGDLALSKIPVADRTTPAGRYFSKLGPAVGHDDVLWIDLKDSISLHPVITTNPKERRLARLASPTAGDNRITFGCVNVAAKFYSGVVQPLFRPAGGIVYVIPETRPLEQVFAGLEPLPVLPSFDDTFAGFSLNDSAGPPALDH